MFRDTFSSSAGVRALCIGDQRAMQCEMTAQGRALTDRRRVERRYAKLMGITKASGPRAGQAGRKHSLIALRLPPCLRLPLIDTPAGSSTLFPFAIPPTVCHLIPAPSSEQAGSVTATPTRLERRPAYRRILVAGSWLPRRRAVAHGFLHVSLDGWRRYQHAVHTGGQPCRPWRRRSIDTAHEDPEPCGCAQKGQAVRCHPPALTWTSTGRQHAPHHICAVVGVQTMTTPGLSASVTPIRDTVRSPAPARRSAPLIGFSTLLLHSELSSRRRYREAALSNGDRLQIGRLVASDMREHEQLCSQRLWICQYAGQRTQHVGK